MAFAIPLFTPFGSVNLDVSKWVKDPIGYPTKTAVPEVVTRGAIAAAITLPFLATPTAATTGAAVASTAAKTAGGVGGLSKIGLLTGGAAGGVLLASLFGGGTKQTQTPTQTTSAAPQTTTQDQKATIKGGITNTRTDSPNITETYTTTNTYSTVNQYGAGTIDSVTSPSVTPSVIGGDSVAQLLAALQGQQATQGQTLTPTQETTQTATGGTNWLMYALIGGMALLGIYMFTKKR